MDGPQDTGGGMPWRYGEWVREVLGHALPTEAAATCADCAMVPRAGCAGDANDIFFDPRMKCCTYLPSLPNYLAGGILADPEGTTADGRATVEARIRAGHGVTPLGVDAPDAYSLLYRSGDGLFGRSRSLRCPHYLEEQGLCGVWRYREATCATWFCKHDQGVQGFRFWDNLRRLLRGVEAELAQWCVLEVGLGEDALAAIFPTSECRRKDGLNAAQLDGVPDPRRLRAQWGEWYGREPEFYRECARVAAALTWDDVRRICGPELRIHETLVRAASRALRRDALPERLTTARLEVTSMGPGSCRVVSYNAYDPLDLSLDLFRVLGYFDGRPTAEALDAIAAEEGLRLHPDLLRRLVDHGILIAVEDAAGP